MRANMLHSSDSGLYKLPQDIRAIYVSHGMNPDERNANVKGSWLSESAQKKVSIQNVLARFPGMDEADQTRARKTIISLETGIAWDRVFK